MLAFLKAPALSEDFGESAAMALSGHVWGKPLHARIHAKVSPEWGRDEVVELGLVLRVRSCGLISAVATIDVMGEWKMVGVRRQVADGESRWGVLVGGVCRRATCWW